MVPKWVAFGLRWAEAGFRKISHSGDLPAPAGGHGVKRVLQTEELITLSIKSKHCCFDDLWDTPISKKSWMQLKTLCHPD